MSEKAKLLVDIVERTLATWLEVFIGLLLAANVWEGTQAGGLVSLLDTAQIAAVSAIPAALAVLKGAISQFIGARNTAAALPTSADTPLPVTGP